MKGVNKKLLPKFKVADSLDLRSVDVSNITVEHLEERIKLREAAVDERVKKLLQ